MLRFLRNYSQSTGIKVLYAALAATFVLWGAGTYQMSRMDAVAKVYDQSISRADLDREAMLQRRRLDQLTRGAYTPNDLDLRSQALDALVQVALVQHEANRLGLGVTEAELVGTIRAMPELQRDGRFDRDLLERVLEFERDRGEFEREIRRDILQRRFRDLVVDGVQITPAELEAEYHKQNDQLSLTFVRFTADEAGKDLAFTDEELATYLREHEDAYAGPPTTRARYVAFAASDYGDLAAPSPAKIEEFYEEHKVDRFTKPEETHARHLLVRVAPNATDAERAAARQKIDDLLAKLKAGADFAALAKEHSDDPVSAARGGDLGGFPRGRMVPAFDEAAFAVPVGSLSEVVETPFGFHVIKVDARDPGGVQELSAVRDQIVAELTKQRGLDLARADADQVRRAVVGGKSLADAAGTHPVKETPPFAETGIIEGLGRRPDFAKTAFALDDGQVSDLIEEDETVYILQPFEHAGPAVPPLAEIRERVLADAKRAAGREMAKGRAEALLARARDVGLAAAATEAGVPTQTTGLFAHRAGSIPILGPAPDLRDAAFALTPAAPLATEVFAVGDDTVVVALADQQPASLAGFEAEKATLEESLLGRKRQATYTRYLDELKQQAMAQGALRVRADALGGG